MNPLVILPYLSKVPAWAWVVAALLAWGAWNGHRAKTIKADFEQAKVAAVAANAASAAEATNETLRRERGQKEALDAKAQELEREAAARAAAVTAGRKLQLRLSALETQACGADPAAAPGGPAASTPADLRAYVQRRLDEAADGIAGYAGGAAAAGRACERSYDALTPGKAR